MGKPVDNSPESVDKPVDNLFITMWITCQKPANWARVLPVDNPMRGHCLRETPYLREL